MWVERKLRTSVAIGVQEVDWREGKEDANYQKSTERKMVMARLPQRPRKDDEYGVRGLARVRRDLNPAGDGERGHRDERVEKKVEGAGAIVNRQTRQESPSGLLNHVGW